VSERVVIEKRDEIPAGVCLADKLSASAPHTNYERVVLRQLLDLPILYAVAQYMLNIAKVPEKPTLHYSVDLRSQASAFWAWP
jgi:hypothetical protein